MLYGRSSYPPLSPAGWWLACAAVRDPPCQPQDDKNADDADRLEAQAAALRLANAETAKDIAALKKDIPEPTPTADPV